MLLTATAPTCALSLVLEDGGPSTIDLAPALAPAVHAMLTARLREASADSRDRAIDTLARQLDRKSVV